MSPRTWWWISNEGVVVFAGLSIIPAVAVGNWYYAFALAAFTLILDMMIRRVRYAYRMGYHCGRLAVLDAFARCADMDEALTAVQAEALADEIWQASRFKL